MKLSLNVALIMGLALAATSINQIKCQVGKSLGVDL